MKILIGLIALLLSLSLNANDKKTEKNVKEETTNTTAFDSSAKEKSKKEKEVNRKPASTETDYFYSPEFPSFMGF